MSAEERLYKQLEGIVSSIINALEGLEKEFSEYIEETDKRIQRLEDKVHKFESLADVSGKGLVKAIEKMIADDEFRKKTIKKGKNLISKEYTMQKHIKSIFNFIN